MALLHSLMALIYTCLVVMDLVLPLKVHMKNKRSVDINQGGFWRPNFSLRRNHKGLRKEQTKDGAFIDDIPR